MLTRGEDEIMQSLAEQGRLDTGGGVISANSIAARIGADNQARVDAKLREWFQAEAGKYTADDLTRD